jgi:hypothetical protein
MAAMQSPTRTESSGRKASEDVSGRELPTRGRDADFTVRETKIREAASVAPVREVRMVITTDYATERFGYCLIRVKTKFLPPAISSRFETANVTGH